MDNYVGMNKFGHHASATLLSADKNGYRFEILLKERLTRKKYDAGSIHGPLAQIAKKIDFPKALFFENSAFDNPLVMEKRWDSRIPYFQILQHLKIGASSANLNPSVSFVTHHLCHAYAALAVSPFEKSLIVVLDGRGNFNGSFPPEHPEKKEFPVLNSVTGHLELSTECCTVYFQNGPVLTPVHKDWQASELSFGLAGASYGLGRMYGTAARYIFGSFNDAGKLMGLAPFGRGTSLDNLAPFINALNWDLCFRGAGKSDWERSGNFQHYADIAATVQDYYELKLVELLEDLRRRFPDYSHLILTGGCALNCQANSLISGKRIFDSVFVPPFPGDESISLGAAVYGCLSKTSECWKPLPLDEQRGNWGPLNSIPTSNSIENCFKGFRIERHQNIAAFCAWLLGEAKIIGWFQGRSESGPRALGNRSLLANPLSPGISDYLNNHIKKRESFRPFAPSCLFEKVHEYFDVPSGFESPFMSFAPKLRASHRQLLAEVGHIDGSARVQTVRSAQNPRFYDLIDAFGNLTGVWCILNTSLNVMGEPIVETLEDAKRLLKNLPLFGMAVEDYFVYNC